jgi:hypothetical protein
MVTRVDSLEALRHPLWQRGTGFQDTFVSDSSRSISVALGRQIAGGKAERAHTMSLGQRFLPNTLSAGVTSLRGALFCEYHTSRL